MTDKNKTNCKEFTKPNCKEFAKQIEIQTPHLALFCARRNSGKSYLMRHLVHQLTKAKRFAWIYLISPTALVNGEWNHIGQQNITDTYNAQSVEKLMFECAKIRKKDPSHEGLIIMDDCLSTVKLDDPVLCRLYTTGRHFGITLWISSQYLLTKSTPTILRSQVDYLFSFKQPKNAIENIYESYAPDGVDSWQELRQKLEECIQNHGCLVIDNFHNGTIHTVRAPEIEAKYTLVKKVKKRINNKKTKK